MCSSNLLIDLLSRSSGYTTMHMFNTLTLQRAQLISIPALTLEIDSEFPVFGGDGILSDMGEAEERQESTEHAQRTGNIERILSARRRAIATRRLDVGEDISSDKGSDLPDSSGDGVILASNSGGAGLGGYETDVVAWT